MRRHPLPLVVATFAAALVLGATPAAGEELPPGFTDGTPVGSREAATAPAAGTRHRRARRHQRYFGQGAYAAVRDAVAGTSRSCTISDNGLTALVLAPVFKESSAATTASTAPSPMTLSRYDEWNGVFSTSMGTPENNYGLYAFRNPPPPTSGRSGTRASGSGSTTPPGSARRSPPSRRWTSDGRRRVATVMADEYCNPSAALIGHAAPFTARSGATRPGATGATRARCARGSRRDDRHDARLRQPQPGCGDRSARRRGGATCTLDGVAGHDALLVRGAAVGAIQGATAWATLTPLDGGSTTVAPTPLSHPFYVVDRGATEERHWLRADTGYAIDIRASRHIGRDARPVHPERVGAHLGEQLRGCATSPPAAATGSRAARRRQRHGPVAGSYQPIARDANGDGREDVLWYAPGSGRRPVVGTGPGTFSAATLIVTYARAHRPATSTATATTTSSCTTARPAPRT